MINIHDIKKLKRFQEIVKVLLKYGFEEIVDRFELPGSDLLQKVSPVEDGLNVYERIRLALEELGPTFIKFGQVMSLRPDLLPEAMLKELEKLQDEVPPMEFNEVEEEIYKSLPPPLNKHFSIFHSEPVAAASLSQVHRGILRSNDAEVAIKVQRPGIEKKMNSDLNILETIGSFVDQQFEELRSYDIPGLIETVRRTLIQELDFTRELDNMNIARAHIKSEKIYIPKAYEDYSSKKLLVMEFFDGKRFRGILSHSEHERKKVAQNGLYAATKQILEDGFFHADPHPGNLLVGKDMQLCFIDWGMVGRLTEHERIELIELLSSVVKKDGKKLTQSLLRVCQKEEFQTDEKELERAVIEILDRYHSIPLSKVNIRSFLLNILTLLRRFHLRLPNEFVIMIKALVTADGTARLAYPELNIVDEVSEQVEAISRKRFRPIKIWDSIKESFSTFLLFKRDFPGQLANIFEKLEKGDLAVKFQFEKLDNILNSLEIASNRLTVGIITGAIIIGSSMIITTGVKPFLFGYPALGVIGYLISVVLGLWLVFTILKNKN